MEKHMPASAKPLRHDAREIMSPKPQSDIPRTPPLCSFEPEAGHLRASNVARMLANKSIVARIPTSGLAPLASQHHRFYCDDAIQQATGKYQYHGRNAPLLNPKAPRK